MRRLLIVGASARATAASAHRAGFVTVAIDLFADRDLKALGPAFRVDPGRYPAALADQADDFPGLPRLYTGGLENHPKLVARLAASGPLWGNTPEVLERVRDPGVLAESLRDAGFIGLEIRDRPPADRSWRWMLKPIRSAGGHEVAPWTGGGEARLPAGMILQRRAAGPCGAAIFIGREGAADLQGVTRQLLAPRSRRYAGSIGPWNPGATCLAELRGIGHHLARHFGLRGLFGVDFIREGGRPAVVEVNPRYTASVEVLELALGRSFLADHAGVFGGGPAPEIALPGRPTLVGKTILYARRDFDFPGLDDWQPAASWERPDVADVPERGEPIRAGDPILTVFAEGDNLVACRRNLAAACRRWRRRIEEIRAS